MRKVLTTLALLLGVSLCSSTLSAGYTMFDTVKDSMIIARGEFVGLERTAKGDRLTFRCDEFLKGSLSGSEMIIEPFEIAPADNALGREAIVGVVLIDGKYKVQYMRRSIIMESDDVASDGLDQNAAAIKALVTINAKYSALIITELQKRLELQNMAYEGKFPASLIDEWKTELVRQCSLTGTWAARDAAKVLYEHGLFKGKVTTAELQKIGNLLPGSAVGQMERAYMAMLVRQDASAQPSLDAKMVMLLEETSRMCVGHIANMLSVEEREMVNGRLAAVISDPTVSSQQRINVLQVLGGFGLKGDASHVGSIQSALSTEVAKGSDFNKNIVRAALSALRDTPDASSTAQLEQYMETDECKLSWELTRRALIAYSVIDSKATNGNLRQMFKRAKDPSSKKFIGRLLPNNKDWRRAVMIFNED